MRYEKGHKDTTRKRIIAAASQRFREDGVEAVGVAGLMAEAGLTHGGFYSHFGSKEDLVRDALTDALDQGRELLEQRARDGGIDAIIRSYLSPTHRDHPGQGCALACLLAELARHPAPTRTAVTERLCRLATLIADHLPGADSQERQDRAFAIVAVMAGTLQMARAVPDTALSDRILGGGVASALTLAHSPQNISGEQQ